MSGKQYSKELKPELVKQHLEDGLAKQNADLCNYSAEFKMKKIVFEYPEGNITSQDLAAKYKIHAPTTVRAWVKNNHTERENTAVPAVNGV